MARNFPHIADSEFPNVSNVDVYKYSNDIDYSRFDYTQMEITICSVPWDMGEAHVGNRTISGIGNVVYFEDKKARDAWFASLDDSECYRFETKLRQLHSDNIIDVPLPFDIASKYNYCYVRYSLVANDNSLLQYEHDGGLREWFWFIREVEFLSPNTTRLHLMADAWQTFIYDLDITGMMLERGHAPAFEVLASDYLKDPVANAGGLLAQDVDFGQETRIVRSSDAIVFNDKDSYAVFVTTADIAGTWGTKTGTWQTAVLESNLNSGYPSYYMFAVALSNLQTFIANCQSATPQFLQTVKCVFFIGAGLLSLGTAVSFNSVSCYPVIADSWSEELLELDKSLFGYPEQYADIAKLYTYPYAHIEIADEKGNLTVVKVEETAGTIELDASLNGLFPYIAINCHINGIGGSAGGELSFFSVNEMSFTGTGTWYDTLYSWNIPTFGIVQSESTHNDYATHYDRAQQKIAADNEYSARENDADNIIDNADLNQAANTAGTTADNTAAQSIHVANIDLNNAQTGIADETTSNTTNNQIDFQYASGAISAGASALGAVASAVANPIGAVSSLIGGVIDAGAAVASVAASVNLTTSQASDQILANDAGNGASNTAARGKYFAGIANNNAHLTAANDLIEGQAANNAATTIANAALAKNTGYSAIDNQIAQAGLDAPVEFGSIAQAAQAASRPLGLWANVVTESDYAIARAGDEFLRYGYVYNRYWEFDGNWNIGDRFTYWKLSDFWVKGLNIPDMYVDKIRFFLFGGVTIWSAPEYIGNTSIYENGL